MYLQSISLTNFRNYPKSKVELSPGVNILIGGNGAGKSNMLEAAQYSCCGRSFRTSREAEMVAGGETFFRLETELVESARPVARAVSYEPGSGSMVEAGGGSRWIGPAAVLSFSPDDLQLVKGPPAIRRRFLDDSIATITPSHQKLVRDYSQVLSQRNRFLQRAAAGLVSLTDISPWDRQLAGLAIRVTTARQEYCFQLAPIFNEMFQKIAGEGEPPQVRLVSQLDGVFKRGKPEAELGRVLEREWLADMERQGSGTGSHKDDLEIISGSQSVRMYGSQGEQRTAVLALLLAGGELARTSGAPEPILLLDDVMSELEPARRRRLMGALGEYGGQALITAADRELFSYEELESARVFEVSGGAVTIRERSRV